jgi:dienelactone hydrolase
MTLHWMALAMTTSVLFGQQPDRARAVIDLLLQENYAQLFERFTPKMKEALPVAAMETAFRPRFRELGAVQKILDSQQVQKGGGLETVVVPVVFEKASVNIQLTFNEAGEVAGMYFRPGTAAAAPWQPPAYSRPDAFRSEEVTVGKGEWALPGTLLMPVTAGPLPAVVLVHGSGPNDRDESVGANKPFRDLAEGLASRGIAVLRYDKRTKVYGAKMSAMERLTVREETVDDAVAAAELLRAHAGVDQKRIFVLGHSLGGYLAPRIAQQDPKLAGLIVLAGSTRPLEELIIEQTEYLASLKPNASPEEKRQIEQLRTAAARLKTLKPGDNVPASELLGVPAPYWLDLKGYDPAAQARSLKIPMLVLQGERDYQVTLADFARWKEALGARNDVVLKTYPDLNHLFETGTGKSRPEEYMKPQHVAPEVIDDIAKWILKKQ